jgi:hypothetical protein
VYSSILGLSFSGPTEGILCIGWISGQSFSGLEQRTVLYRARKEGNIIQDWRRCSLVIGLANTGLEQSAVLYRASKQGSFIQDCIAERQSYVGLAKTGLEQRAVLCQS